MSLRWSNSVLSTFLQCAERGRRRYIERERGLSSLSLIRGTTVHRVAAESHKRQMRERDSWLGEEPELANLPGSVESVREAADIAASRFDASLAAEDVALTPDERATGKAQAVAAAKDATVSMAKVYVGTVAPEVVPVAVERKIVLKPKDSDLVIDGRVDLVAGLPDGTESVRDLKSTARKPPAQAADESGQLTMYHMLRTVETGKAPSKVVLEHLVLGKGGVSRVTQESTRGPADHASLIARINVAVKAVDAGVFVPNTSGWWCGEKWCEFFETCPYVADKRTRR